MLVKLNSVLLFSMLCLPPSLSPLTSQFCPLTGVLKRPIFVLVGQLSQLYGLLMFLCLHHTAWEATVVSFNLMPDQLGCQLEVARWGDLQFLLKKA